MWFLLEIFPISLLYHSNRKKTNESGGVEQAEEQFALSSMLMGLKIMFLSKSPA